jgi:hypothetical protein
MCTVCPAKEEERRADRVKLHQRLETEHALCTVVLNFNPAGEITLIFGILQMLVE